MTRTNFSMTGPRSFDRLSEAFYTTKAEGMAMVLSICRSIVDAHGGRIRGSRTAGPGATFQLTLPMHGERA